jgi:hypothetical protein
VRAPRCAAIRPPSALPIASIALHVAPASEFAVNRASGGRICGSVAERAGSKNAANDSCANRSA